jgi:hypothetical protein
MTGPARPEFMVRPSDPAGGPAEVQVRTTVDHTTTTITDKLPNSRSCGTVVHPPGQWRPGTSARQSK